uniref:Leukocyte cell derived chemotaxin 2 n=1 Tax=Equus asinus TaxID=9793 RepID=A0A9L0IS21_EQUAS
MFSTGVIFLAVLISTALAGPWANICAGKSSNEIRTCDSHGCGRYTAQSHRPHQGVDVLCSDGSTVYAPFTGMIVAQEKPYKDKNAINNGVRLSGRGKRWCIYLGHRLDVFGAYLFNEYSIHRSFRLPRKL